jgi:hypothetical protein
MTNRHLLPLILLVVVSSASIAQPYAVGWRDFVNTSVIGGNAITKSAGAPGAWDAGATTYNTLAPNTDGYVQVTYSTTNLYYMIGLAQQNRDANYATIDWAFYVAGGSLFAYESNVSSGAYGTLANGDVLKVAREGTNIKYYKNGVVVRTTAQTAVQQQAVLIGDVCMYHMGSTVYNVVTSFDKTINLQPTFTFPTVANNNGAISLNPEGGDAPYTYSWSTGETTSSISGKARDTYTVTVTDAGGRVVTAPYNLGYAVGWGNLSNVVVNADGSLTRTGGGQWAAGAFSRNRIDIGANGYFEFVMTDLRVPIVIGLSDMDRTNSYPSIVAGLAVDATGAVRVYNNGGASGYLPGVKKGDIIRVARIVNNINFYKNGVQIHTMGGSSAYAFFIDAAVGTNAAPTPVITTDFPMQPLFKPTYVYPDATNANGSIALNPEGVYAPATYLWAPDNETTATITNKSRNMYTVSYNDALLHAVSKTYRLGYPVTWTDLQNVVVNADNSVTQTAGVAWQAAALSANKLDANMDGWIEFVIPPGNGTVGIGFGRQNNVTNLNSIEYCFYLAYGSNITVYEAGVNKGISVGALYEGDILTIAREGSNIKYYINGTAVRTIATTASWELYVDLTFNGQNLPSPIVQCSFGRTPQTFYARSHGNWNVPATWSLTDGGPAAVNYPAPGDIANIKGYNVTVTTGIAAPTVNINANNNQTSLKVDGAWGILKVKGTVNVLGTTNTEVQSAFVVQNEGRVAVIP